MATLLTVLTGILRLVFVVGIVLCFVLLGWTEGYSDAFSQGQSEFRFGLLSDRKTENIILAQDNEDWTAPSREEQDRSLSFSDETIQEEDLPSKVLPDYTRENWPPVSENELSPSTSSYSFPSDEERSLPFEGQSDSLDSQSVPERTPPFMSRPFEWEKTPPTVIGAPPLPPLNSFSNRELAAFTFIEEGKAYFDRGEWESAQEQFERAIGLAPFLPYGYYFLGRIAFAGKDLQSALAFLQKAELLFPRTEHAWLGETTSVKGAVYEELKDYVEARETYKQSLRFQPANLKVLSALARLPEEEPPFREPIP